MMNPSTPIADHPANKPGWKTSEFWVTMATVVGGLLQAGFAKNTGAGIAGMVISTAAGAAYTAGRSYTKANAPVAADSGYLMGSGRDGGPVAPAA
jgi:hypothetical protein